MGQTSFASRRASYGRPVLLTLLLSALVSPGSADEFSTVEHQRQTIYHSLQTPGYTSTVRDLKPPLVVRALIGTETDDGFEFDFAHDRIMLDAKTPVGKPFSGLDRDWIPVGC